MKNKFSPPRLIFKVYANETLEQAEQLAIQQDLPLRECINHTAFKHAFTLVQTTSVNENLGEEGVGEWAIRDASDWACKNLNHSFGIGINAIWDEDKRYTTSYMFRLIRYLLDNPNEFRVDQDIIVYNEKSFTKWSNQNLQTY